MCVCVHVCACECVRVCVHAYVCVCVHMHASTLHTQYNIYSNTTNTTQSLQGDHYQLTDIIQPWQIQHTSDVLLPVGQIERGHNSYNTNNITKIHSIT